MPLSTLCWTMWTPAAVAKFPQIGGHSRNFALLFGKQVHTPGRPFRTISNGPNTTFSAFIKGPTRSISSSVGSFVLRQFIMGKRRIYTTALKLKHDPANPVVVPVPKNIPKSKVSKKEFSRLMSLAKSEKWTLTGAITLLLISSAVTMSVPFCLGRDDPKATKENLTKVSIALLGIFLIGGMCNFGRTYLMHLSGQRITNKMRTSVFSAILKQDIAFFDKTKTGELVNRLSADTALVSQSVAMNISDGLRSTFMITAGVGMMICVSPKLAIVGLSIVPPVAGTGQRAAENKPVG